MPTRSVSVHGSNGDLLTAGHVSSRIPVRMATLSLIVFAREDPPTRRKIRLKWKSKASSFNAITQK